MPYAQLAIAAYGAYNTYKNKPSDASAKAYQAAMAQLQKVPVPDPETLKVELQQLVQQGLVDPESANAVLVQHNAYDEVSGNDQARGAQLEALQSFQDQASAGGLSDTSRASIQATLDEVANTERGQRQAIGEDARRRGVSGSGLELAEQLMAQQSSADQAGRRGMDIAALAEQAKIDALKNAANIGTTVQGQDLETQSNKAAAANQIAMYNATNQQDVTLKNIAARNLAQQQNLAEKQRVSDTNTTMENQNRIRNSDLKQKEFENNVAKANAMKPGGDPMAAYDAAKRAYSGDVTAGMLKTVGDYGAAGGFKGIMPPTTPKIDTTSNAFLTNDALNRKKVLGYAHGGKVECYDEGGLVPGEAEYPGDDSRNDDVLAKLSPGEAVIPRTKVDAMESDGIDVDALLTDAPRTAQKPSVEAVKTLLQALTDMGC